MKDLDEGERERERERVGERDRREVMGKEKKESNRG